MHLNSIPALFQYLPCVLILYYIVPKKAKNATLFVLSVLLYSWGQLRNVPIVLGILIVTYFSALGLEYLEDRIFLRRLLLAGTLIFDLGLLFVFRYYDFAAGHANMLFSLSLPLWELEIPLGLALYELHALSYTLDVYRNRAYAERDFIDLAAFMTFFPVFLTGPVILYRDMDFYMRSRQITPAILEEGVEDIIIGLARKTILADNLSVLGREIRSFGLPSISTGLAWMHLLVFGLQLYYELSGYSQMAIGVAKLFGFPLKPNYESPLSSRTIIDFCRRWNVSLRRWFHEYVYVPMGGSRKGIALALINLFVVWLLVGIWYGPHISFILWCLYLFFFVSIEKIGLRGFMNKHVVISRIYTQLVLLLGWAVLSSGSISELLLLANKLFVFSFVGDTATVTLLFYLRNYAVLIAIALFFSTGFASRLYKKLTSRTFVRIVLMVALLVLCISYNVEPARSPFEYFRL